MTDSDKDLPATEQEACHIDARAAGCFGGKADPCHSGQPAPLDADTFMSLYTKTSAEKTPGAVKSTCAADPA